MHISSNEPLDYRYIDINRAFEKQPTLKDAQGKWMRELRPEHEDRWYTLLYLNPGLRYRGRGSKRPQIQVQRHSPIVRERMNIKIESFHQIQYTDVLR